MNLSVRRPRRFLFVTFDGGGNMTPTLGAACELAARGHEVMFLGQPSQEDSVERRGFAFTPFAHAPEWARGLAVEEERDALFGFFLGPDTASEARLVIERTQPHAIIVDCLLSAALAAAERSSLPVAALFHLLYQPFVDGGFARQMGGLDANDQRDPQARRSRADELGS
jgi:UDP:flavonoid glycosyltransferase YjiC (YdhE family)